MAQIPLDFGNIKIHTSAGSTLSINQLNEKILGVFHGRYKDEKTMRYAKKWKKFQDALGAAGKQFVIVYVSNDRKEDEFKTFISEYPDFLYVDYQNKNLKKAIRQHLNVTTLPHLYVCNLGGAVIVDDEAAKKDLELGTPLRTFNIWLSKL